MPLPILPLPMGAAWNIKKKANWSTIIQRGYSGREVRSPLYTNPIWEWELPWNYLWDYITNDFINYPPPSAPTLTGVSWGVAGQAYPPFTYYCVITYVYPDGETAASNETVFTPTNPDTDLQVASPSDPSNGCLGWNCYVGSWSGGETWQNNQVVNSGPIPFGTNWLMTSDGLTAHPNDPNHLYLDENGVSVSLTPPVYPPNVAFNQEWGWTPWQTLLGFYNSMQGAFGTFLLADATDSWLYNSIGTGDGATTQFQLTRNYGGFSEIVQAPVATIGISVAGTTLLSGYSVSATGLVTLTSAPTAGQDVFATGGFFYPCRFTEDSFEGVNTMYNWWKQDALKIRSVKL